MALDFSDLLFISIMSDHPHRAEDKRNFARQRANNLRDNFGVNAMELDEYRARNGGSGIGKALLLTVAGLAIGAAFISFGTSALLIGLGLGAIAGSISYARHEEKTVTSYNTYLDGVAAQARQTRDRGLDQSQEYDNGSGRNKSYVADLEASKRQLTVASAHR